MEYFSTSKMSCTRFVLLVSSVSMHIFAFSSLIHGSNVLYANTRTEILSAVSIVGVPGIAPVAVLKTLCIHLE